MSLRRWLRRALAIVIACLATAAGPAVAQMQPFKTATTRDGLGREVSYHLVRPDAPRGLLLFVQGSGCASHFPVIDGRRRAGYANLLADGARDFAVMAVEKPGVTPGNVGREGTAEGCGEAFLREHTLDRWATALAAAVATWSAGAGPIVAIGHSEGASAAARLARVDPRITHLAFLSGTGPSQRFDFEVLARRRGGEAAAQAIAIEVGAIRADPESIARFAWGHPYRRWTSFLDASPIDDLLATRARLFLVHGTADDRVPIESFEAAVVALTQAGRDARFERRDGADHALNRPGQRAPEGMREVFAAILAWVASS